MGDGRLIYDGRRKGAANPYFHAGGKYTHSCPSTYTRRFCTIHRPHRLILIRRLEEGLRVSGLIFVTIASLPGASAGRHTILSWTKKKDLESTSRWPQQRAEALLVVGSPEQQLFGLAGLKIGSRADFKRPICG